MSHPQDRKAVTTIVTVEMDGKNYVLLNAVDPRWRINPEGKFIGINANGESQAFDAFQQNGSPTKLPLSGLKFIGGFVDKGKTLKQAAHHELKEEAGRRLGNLAAKNLKHVYTLTRPMDRWPGASVEVTYLHAHLKLSKAEFSRLAKPGDDSLALMLVEVDKIAKTGTGYVVTKPSQDIFYRKKYQSIPYRRWMLAHWLHERGIITSPDSKLTPQQIEAFKYYNRHGRSNPFVGIDRESLKAKNISLYKPSGTSSTAQLSPEQIRERGGGLPVPDGAIFTQVVRPSLTAPSPK
jgi:ADP-ribose pyrophosphatase YjhB (NUDIX family)